MPMIPVPVRPSASQSLRRLMAMPVAGVLFLVLLPAVGGCARYEHDVITPQEFAGPVRADAPVKIDRPPLSYTLRTVESRLVMEIHNPAAEAVQLLGDRSVVVDAEGQSHPVPTLTIAPSSFVRLRLPPAERVRTTPRVGLGLGVGYSSYYRGGAYPYGFYGPMWDDPLYDSPRYYNVAPSSPTFWEWPGEGQIRLTLLFDRNGERFTHEWTISRRKL